MESPAESAPFDRKIKTWRDTDQTPCCNKLTPDLPQYVSDAGMEPAGTVPDRG